MLREDLAALAASGSAHKLAGMTTSLDRLRADDFDALIGNALLVRAGTDEVAMQVEAVTRSAYPTVRALPGFSLLLRGPLQPPLQQGLLQFPHPVHGHLELFFTPVRRDARGIVYEIVFN